MKVKKFKFKDKYFEVVLETPEKMYAIQTYNLPLLLKMKTDMEIIKVKVFSNFPDVFVNCDKNEVRNIERGKQALIKVKFTSDKPGKKNIIFTFEGLTKDGDPFIIQKEIKIKTIL